jgi:hypothetical protein
VNGKFYAAMEKLQIAARVAPLRREAQTETAARRGDATHTCGACEEFVLRRRRSKKIYYNGTRHTVEEFAPQTRIHAGARRQWMQ